MAGPPPPPPGWGGSTPWPPPSGPPPPWRPPPPSGAGAPTPSPFAPRPDRIPAPRTDPLAIASLVASIAGIFICLLGQILGIVFGHVARSRIKRSGEGGAGLALAGLIIGYAETALAVAAIVVLAIVYARPTTDATPTARALAQQIRIVANARGETPRSGDVVREAMHELGIADSQVLVGSTSERAVDANDQELEAAIWTLEVHRGRGGKACLAIPMQATQIVRVSAGACPALPFNPALTRYDTGASSIGQWNGDSPVTRSPTRS